MEANLVYGNLINSCKNGAPNLRTGKQNNAKSFEYDDTIKI